MLGEEFYIQARGFIEDKHPTDVESTNSVRAYV